MNTTSNINGFQIFPASVYTVEKPEYLEVTRKVSKKFLDKRKEAEELNSNFPVYMTDNMFDDEELLDFGNFVAKAAWDILKDQGYLMDVFQTYFTEMWVQEHHKGSLMERHIHGSGSVITGFYFLDCPSLAKVVFHEPKDSKVITSLPENNIDEATFASNMIYFNATDGLLMFSNAWLPHSFNKNIEDKPLKFIHFNIAVEQANKQACSTKSKVEVI